MELWYTERHLPDAGLTLRVRETLYTGRSAFQSIEVLDTPAFGRMLLLDGLVMLTERDEFVYHEMIAHPALFTHPAPRDVLVVGGGDGGTVREVLKHGGVRRVVLCEIDEMVVEVARRFFPEVASGLSGDPRVEIAFEDGARYVEAHPGAFDVILVDSTDPVGPAEALFAEAFFRGCRGALREGGLLAAQCESPYYHLDVIRRVRSGLAAAGFPVVRFYTGGIPTYPSGTWCWVMASLGPDPVRDFDAARAAAAGLATRYYSPGLHAGAFALPRFLAEAVTPA
ncbi:polyamine aminopropyltransferase [Dissulfurirhabdus thermomarina]|uniref:Polyamine aminopropyltransferase n=1 Tax=Dissulfurirhabdus thermomarina TaxID=1765737 RepID=A0A6N9TPN5_DISTH|nr:polyamine aminopropyltransferase [Dissulfurirhabdus thermomarina]NDY43235.1 polyamine aminopropyltransferase [Dissulfurirhabdus thermomarina]NMX23025.1 polyamine aminopropyltransferase [Dissulfurirhabdus thermomarina]